MQIPLYQKVYQSFKTQIENGHLVENSRLPSIRQLTKDMAVSRTTIETAYEMLCADGLVTCVPQSGFYVNTLPQKTDTLIEHYENDNKYILPRAQIRYDFSGKQMDNNTFDFDIWRKLSRYVMQNSKPFLGYGDNQGEVELRKQIQRYLAAGRGVYTGFEQILIAAGVQSLLHILCEMFDKTRMRIAFEDPGFQKGFQVFKAHGYDAVFIKGGQIGIDIEKLYLSKANMLYISPSHAFPSGATLPHEKRLQLLEWASRVNGIIFEDDYDGELRYTGKPLATLTSLDVEERVIYLGTFSKLLPPSVRISYAAIPNRHMKRFREILGLYNQTSSTMEQLTMARFIEEGRLEKQIRRLRRIYSRKNEAITHSFKKYFGNYVKLQPNDTGLHVILTVRLGKSAEKLAELAQSVGVLVTPMSDYHLGREKLKTAEIYMSSASISEEDIPSAVALLKKVWVCDN